MELTIALSLLLLLACSSFFSASETALMSVDKIKLKNKVNKGEKNADLIERLLERPDQLLSTILVGNNVVNILASSLATALFSSDRLFGPAAGVAASTLIMTPLVLIFGEVTPKSLAARYPFRTSKKFIVPIKIMMKILHPFVKLLTLLTNMILKLFGISNMHSVPGITEEEVRLMVNLGEETGSVKEYEKDMIQSIFEFDDIEVRDIMIPRMYMTAISVDSSYEDVRACILEHQFSRIPVYEESVDHVIGILYVKDLFFLAEEDIESFDLIHHIKPAFFVPEFMKLNDLFKEMKRRKVHMSIVIDEYGGTAGMTTMEDVIEEVLGDIEDEYDVEEEEVKKIRDNIYLLDAKMKISDLNELLETEIPEENVSSIGGFIFEQLGEMPTLKQRIYYEHLVFIVEEMEQRRIKKIKLLVRKEEQD